MRLVDIRKEEDCFDGSRMFELVFDRPLPEEAIRSLGVLGILEYFSDFPRPFYRLTAGDRYLIKGVRDGETAKLHLFRGGIDSVRKEIESV